MPDAQDLEEMFLEADIDLQHGNHQVRKMLADRPAMALFETADKVQLEINPQTEVWKWAAKAYGCRLRGASIEWDGSEMDKPMQYMADHTIPNDGASGLIRIRKTFKDQRGRIRDATIEELWSACVFELCNLYNADGFIEIFERAVKGKVSREEWVHSNTRLEHKALMRQVAFYESVWKPWADEVGFVPDPKAWKCDTPKNYEDCISPYDTASDNPYGYWGNYYDEQIVPYLKATGQQ